LRLKRREEGRSQVLEKGGRRREGKKEEASEGRERGRERERERNEP